LVPAISRTASVMKLSADDQAIDGDAELAVDQKWIDIDRGDAVAGIRHQV